MTDAQAAHFAQWSWVVILPFLVAIVICCLAILPDVKGAVREWWQRLKDA